MLLVASSTSFSAHGAFEPVDFNLDGQIDGYSDVQAGVIWHVNAGASGLRTFPSAQSWVDGLVVGENSSWRLPTVFELESMYQTLVSNYPRVTTGPFQNVQLARYWSTTPADAIQGWNETLDMRNGLRYEHPTSTSLNMHAWAVQSVPEPESLLLMLGGLSLFSFITRKRSEA